MLSSQIQNSTDIYELLTHFKTYTNSRAQFLNAIGLPNSCRDPFAEFSEILVSKLLPANLAESRVQRGFDLIRPDGRLVQVKYLSNPAGKWINEHPIFFPESVDEYALVIYIALQVESVLVFKRKTLSKVCVLLGKRHPNQNLTLQFTKRNYETILSNPALFEELGMEVYNLCGL